MAHINREARIEERRQKVAANLLAGLTYRQMAAAFGVGLGTIARDVAAIHRRLRDEEDHDVQQWRALQLARLDRLLNAIWGDAMGGDLAAIDRALKIGDQRARLLGLYAPEKIAPTDLACERSYAPLSEDERVARLTVIFERARLRKLTTAAPSLSPPADTTGNGEITEH